MRTAVLHCVLAATLLLAGCCGQLKPSPEQVRTWVDQELPPGSSEADVQAFAARRQFTYARHSANSAQAFRAVDGCDWKKPVIQVEITYDDSSRVRSTNVRAFSTGLP